MYIQVPLMRSKDKKIKFCVVCDGSPDTVSKKSSPLADAQPRHLPTPSAEPSTDEELELREDESDYMSPIPSQESTARRQQSDKASQLIGQKLLAGWIILEDTCPNSSCYGVGSHDKKPSLTIQGSSCKVTTGQEQVLRNM